MLRQCRTTTKTIELFDRLRESERAPAKSGAFFLRIFGGRTKNKREEAIGFPPFIDVGCFDIEFSSR
jgi:hypothetical protein